ncbi:MAG: hypothetical protein J6B96_05630 [Agathobacter sp.]|nr:hypothetical protein [Agathobacter sp.]
MEKVITEKQDLTYLRWSHIRSSSGTAGTFLKSQSVVSGEKIYYKLSNFDSDKGVVGHECVNEIIVDRLLTLLGVEHLEYQLIHADIEVEGKVYDTWLCASKDFKKAGESKAALDNYYQVNKRIDESRYDFCVNNGWQEYIDRMLVVDYLILNRDRHGANVEVLRDARRKKLRIAPLFDHGLSFLCSCQSSDEIMQFDILEDKPCQNFFGSRSTYENLKYIEKKQNVFVNVLKEEDKELLLADLETVLSKEHWDKIWDMLWARWCEYEKLWNL